MDGTHQAGKSSANDYNICCIAVQKTVKAGSGYRFKICLKVHSNPRMSFKQQGYFFPAGSGINAKVKKLPKHITVIHATIRISTALYF